MHFISSSLIGLSLLGFAVSYGEIPPSDVDTITQITPTLSTKPVQPVNLDKLQSVVVPQIGVLEEVPGAIGNKQDNTVPIIIANPNGSGASTLGNMEMMGGNSAKGILVPIVSVIDPDTPKNMIQQLNNPLVALLPAPPTAAPLPIINGDNQRPVIEPEVNR